VFRPDARKRTRKPKKPVQELQRQGTCVDSVQIPSPRLSFETTLLLERRTAYPVDEGDVFAVDRCRIPLSSCALVELVPKTN
jgi:hypothetical protein